MPGSLLTDTDPGEQVLDRTDERVAKAVAAARRVPLWAHVLLLAAVLLGLLAFLDNGTVGNADEGAVLAQARILQQHGEWGMHSPTASIDPTGRWFPIDLTERVGDEWFPYTKHTIYPRLVAVVEEHGGLGGVLALHVLGVVATAAAAAVLARRIARGWERLTLWTVGLATPLLFDGYWVIAHSLAAAGAVVAVIGVLMALERRPVTGSALACAAVLWTVMLRSEGTLFGLAVTLGLGVAWLVRRTPRSLGLAAAVFLTTAIGYLGDAQLERLARGGAATTPFHIQDKQGFLAGRVNGAWNTLLSPVLGNDRFAAIAALAAAALGATAWAYLRFRPAEVGTIRIAAIASAALWVGRIALGGSLVPGLLIACPILVAAAFSFRRSVLSEQWRLMLVVCGLYAAGVFATQYGAGGSGDWGGRYLHLAVPILVPVALLTIGAATASLEPRLRRALVGSLVVSSLALSTVAVVAIRDMHDITREAVEGVHDVAMTTREARSAGGPVVITDNLAFGRFSWAYVTTQRYLAVSHARDLPKVVAALSDAGVDDFVFAESTPVVERRLELLQRDGYTLERRVEIPSLSWTVAVLSRTKG
jgi:hypothetical protein